MKVLHFSPKYSVISETFIYDQINALQQLGIECSVVSNERLNAKERPFHSVHIIPNKKIISDRVTRKLAFGKGFELLPLFIDYDKWKKLLITQEPDIIHCHTGNAIKAWYHIRQRLTCNLPLLISLHGSDVTMEPNLKKNYRRFLRIVAQDNRVYWTVPSMFLKEKALNAFGMNSGNILVVNNGFNNTFSDKHDQPIKNEIKILSIGRFIPCKGHKYLLQALPELLVHFPDASITFIGDGPLYEQSVLLAQELQIADKVTFIRSLPHYKVAEMMMKHNYYVQPSIIDSLTLQEESFGVAALEAIASGLPCVVTRCGGLPEVVDILPDKYGKVVPQKDASAIADALCELIQHGQGQRIPQDLSKLINDKFSMEQNALNVINIYNQILKN